MSEDRQREGEGHTGAVIWQSEDHRLIDCIRCGFVHVLPLPDVDGPLPFLPPAQGGGLPASPGETGSAGADSVGPSADGESPPAVEEAEARWLQLIQEERYALFEQLLEGGARRLLDVGCGEGLFLVTGERLGWETLGIEPDREAAGRARRRGLEVRQEPLPRIDLPSLGRFDVVQLAEVLERIPWPLEYCRLAGALLEPGGLICVETANDFNPLQRLARERLGKPPYWIAPSRQLNHFTFDSLGRLLERCGFQEELRRATFPVELFLLMGEDFLDDPQAARRCRQRQLALETHLLEGGGAGLRAALSESLARQGIGARAVIIARKPEMEMA